MKMIRVKVDAYYSIPGKLEVKVVIRNLSVEKIKIDGYRIWLYSETQQIKDDPKQLSRILQPVGRTESEIVIPISYDTGLEIATRGKIRVFFDGMREETEFDVRPPSIVEVLEIQISEPRIERIGGEEFRFYPTYIVMHPRRPLITDEVLMIPSKEIDRILNRVKSDLISKIPGIKVGKELVRGIGKTIYNILNENLKLSDMLNSLNPKYLIFETSKAGWDIPLELMFDGQEFLVIKYAVGRILRSTLASGKIDPKKFIKKRRGIKKIAAIFSYVDFEKKKPDEIDPKEIIREMVKFFKGLKTKGIEVHSMEIQKMDEKTYTLLLSGDDMPKALDSSEVPSAVEEFLMAEDYDLIYISAHGFRDGNIGEPYIKVTKTEHQLRASRIAKLNFEGKPIIILNACLGGSALAESFLVAGARALIAPIFEVDLTSAYVFTKELLKDDFLEGRKPIGKVLQEVKMKMKERIDIDWLTFILYGDPRLYP